MNKKLVHGIGVYEAGKYTSSANGKISKEYILWNDMIKRCYSDKCQVKQPSYIGCTVSEEFKSFQGFMSWAELQVGFGKDGFRLDKDILYKGYKLYGPETCSFVPSSLNNLLVNRRAMRGDFPIGVIPEKGRFRATIGRGSRKREKLGIYATPEEAFKCYKDAKEVFIRQQADKYKDCIDPRVYTALLSYKVDISD